MSTIELLFWGFLFLLFYSYLGYGLLMFVLVKLKKLRGRIRAIQDLPDSELPAVTLMVAAYNEEDYIAEKIENSLALDYPQDKLKLLFVTDGSDDSTPDIVAKYPQVKLMHQPERQGKIAAVNRCMPHVETDLVVFSDANTHLNKEALRKIVRHYADEKVGAVAGEKRIMQLEKDQASGAGEGFYWKYESALKKWDSEMGSVVGAAGELFSIRTHLHEPISQDTLIEDFYLTMRIVEKGYRVAYEDEACAEEASSASVKEEQKRKVRIAAGGIQAIVRLTSMLNFFKHGFVSFQYVSHRVLRWSLAPLGLLVILLSNSYLALQGGVLYPGLFALQTAFYLFAYLGKLMEAKELKVKAFFIPYYFFIMNWSVYLGLIRYVKGSQSVVWEKAARRKVSQTAL